MEPLTVLLLLVGAVESSAPFVLLLLASRFGWNLEFLDKYRFLPIYLFFWMMVWIFWVILPTSYIPMQSARSSLGLDWAVISHWNEFRTGFVVSQVFVLSFPVVFVFFLFLEKYGSVKRVEQKCLMEKPIV